MAPMKRRQLLRLLSVGAAAALAAACQPQFPSEPAPTLPPPTPLPPTPTVAPTLIAATPGIRIGIDVDPDTLDPAGQTNTTVESIVDYMVEGLVRMQADGKIVPGLAKRWDVSADGRVYTFELQKDVHFHDGALLTSDAVK